MKSREQNIIDGKKGGAVTRERCRKIYVEPYNLKPNFCQGCNKQLAYEKRDKIYCSTKCNAIYNENHGMKNRTHSQDTKDKISKGHKKKEVVNRICLLCSSAFDVFRSSSRRCCSKSCSHKLTNIKLKGNSGGYRQGSGRGIKCFYTSPIAGTVHLDSSWELEYAKWLDSKGILWERNTNKFPFIYKNGPRFYIPDFYIIGSNSYVEIKGYKTEIDNFKWKQFPYKLIVLFENDLKSLGIMI